MWKMKGILKIYLMAALLILLMPALLKGFQAERNIAFDLSDKKTREEIAKKQYAFIIGIDQYKEFPPLQNAVNDAKEVKKVLMDRYYFKEDHIKTLFTNDEKDEATYENIINELKEYITDLTADDSLFVLFSGHGFNDMDFDTVYWVPSDAEEHFAKGEMKIGENIILGFLRKCKARHILIVSASCYSGKLFYGRLRGGWDLYKNKKSRQILAAGKGTVSDGKRYEQNSPFVKNFLEYLKANTRHYLLASDMIDDLLRNKEKKYDWPTGQEPIGGAVEGSGDEKGSLVFFYNYSAIERELMDEYRVLLESFNYGRRYFSFWKVFASNSLRYDFKRISSQKAFNLFSVGFEANFHAFPGFALNFGFVETFPGKGSIDYEIYTHPGSSEIVGYSIIDNCMSIFMGIKIYFLKR